MLKPLKWIRTPCGESSHCVELATDGDHVYLRNETDGMRVPVGEWDAFRDAVKAGVFDDENL